MLSSISILRDDRENPYYTVANSKMSFLLPVVELAKTAVLIYKLAKCARTAIDIRIDEGANRQISVIIARRALRSISAIA